MFAKLDTPQIFEDRIALLLYDPNVRPKHRVERQLKAHVEMCKNPNFQFKARHMYMPLNKTKALF